MKASSWLLRGAPAIFVLLWSTGWIAARAAAPFADPLTFLSVRYGCAALALLVFALATGARWPVSKLAAGHALVSGVLLHAMYLGGVWWAVKHGLLAGISGLIAAAQPIMTALLAPYLADERIRPWQWAGIGLGFSGIALVLAPQLQAGAAGASVHTAGGFAALGGLELPVAINLAAMLSVTLGTFYQKRFLSKADLTTTTFLQYAAAGIVTLPAAALLEPMHIEWNAQIAGTLAWSVLGLSIGAVVVFLILINNGAVSRAAALIYLVPPSVALESYLLFGETLTMVQILGMALAACGVALATRR